AREEAELLARLDGGAGEDDAAEAVLHEFGDGHRHSQIGFPRSSWPYTKHDIIAADGVDVALLRHALRRDDPLVRRDEDRVEKDVAQLGVAVARENADRVVHVGGVDRVALLEEAVELDEEAAGRLSPERVARPAERLVGDVDANPDVALERLQVLVVLAEQLAEEPRVVEAERDGRRAGLGQGFNGSRRRAARTRRRAPRPAGQGPCPPPARSRAARRRRRPPAAQAA